LFWNNLGTKLCCHSFFFEKGGVGGGLLASPAELPSQVPTNKKKEKEKRKYNAS
jgi:hypothetical protein